MSYFYLLMTVLLNNVCIAGTETWTSQQIEVAVRREGCHMADMPFLKNPVVDTFSYTSHGRDMFSNKIRFLINHVVDMPSLKTT